MGHSPGQHGLLALLALLCSIAGAMAEVFSGVGTTYTCERALASPALIP